METTALLSGHWMFEGVEPRLLEELADCAESLQAAKGETIYTPHRFRRCLGVIFSGRIRVSKDALVMSTLGAGDLFGAAALFTDCDDYATTLTALNDCRLTLLPQEGVERLLRESPDFAQRYVRYLSGRIQFLSGRLDTLTAGTAEEKVAQYLLSAAGERGMVTISATQLSARIGIGRASLYRAFEALEQQGMICREGKSIRLLNRERSQNL